MQLIDQSYSQVLRASCILWLVKSPSTLQQLQNLPDTHGRVRDLPSCEDLPAGDSKWPLHARDFHGQMIYPHSLCWSRWQALKLDTTVQILLKDWVNVTVDANYNSFYHVCFLIVYSLLKALKWHPLEWDCNGFTGVNSEVVLCVDVLRQTKVRHLDGTVTTHPTKHIDASMSSNSTKYFA